MDDQKCRAGRRWHWALAPLLMFVAVLTGCSPYTQSTVVRDPTSGKPMLVAALCTNERIDAVRVRQSPDETGPVVWEIQRVGDDDLRRVVLGSDPAGFRSTVASRDAIPATGWAEVSLSGGGAARSGSGYDAAKLAALSQSTLDDLAGRAEANCAKSPFRSPWWLALGALGLAAAVIVTIVRWVGRARRRPVPRAAITSPWAYLSAAFGIMVVVVLVPHGLGQHSSPATYLLYGAALSVAAIGLGLIGRLMRQIRFLDWLIVVPGFLFVIVAGLLTTVVAGGLFESSCGPEWTFDCATSLADRLVVLACLIPAWITAAWVAEGGLWPHLLPPPAHPDEHQERSAQTVL